MTRGGAAALTLPLLLVACGSSSAGGQGATRTFAMTQSTAPSASIAVIYVAYDQGFFKKNGIDMRLTLRPAGGLGPPALVNGDTDVADIGFNDIANLRNQGKNTIAVYDLLRRVTSDLVVSNQALAAKGLSPEQPLQDRLHGLRGLRLGITSPGAASDVLTRYLLKQAGINPDSDVQIIKLGSFAGLTAGLSANQIDAFFGAPPSPQQAVQKGLGKILVSSSAGQVPSLQNFYYMMLTMRSDYVARNPEAARAYVKSIHEAYAWMLTHRDGALQSLQQRLPGVDPATVTLGYDAVFDSLSHDGRFDARTVRSTVDAFKLTGALDTVPSLSEGVMWTNKFNP